MNFLPSGAIKSQTKGVGEGGGVWKWWKGGGWAVERGIRAREGARGGVVRGGGGARRRFEGGPVADWLGGQNERGTKLNKKNASLGIEPRSKAKNS